ncbi:hypothetical protein CHMI_01528 [Cellulomonas hominis]|nr:hypothetical protein CHMI_01528 [Cellulomonas hominis]
MKLTGLLALGVCAALLLGGCVPEEEPPPPSDGPVPDEVLFRQVQALPGVASVEDLRFQDPFGYPPAYAGSIVVEEGADPLCVLDQALSVLYQGRAGADLGVLVRTPEKRAYGLLSLVGRDGSALERYGPRSSEPQAEATIRPCTAPEGEVSSSTSTR